VLYKISLAAKYLIAKDLQMELAKGECAKQINGVKNLE